MEYVMDRFDRIAQRAVRLKVDVDGFDLDRSVKQFEKKRTEQKRTKQKGASPSSQAGVNATVSTQKSNPKEPEIAVESVILGARPPEGNTSCKATPFHMDL